MFWFKIIEEMIIKKYIYMERGLQIILFLKKTFWSFVPMEKYGTVKRNGKT
jgi:hypothetical protein